MKFLTAVVCGLFLQLWSLAAQTLDPFNPNPNDIASIIGLQPDGRILASDNFVNFPGVLRRIASINPDGTIDLKFNPGYFGSPPSLAVQPDGKILIAGNFTILGGQFCTNIGR